MPISTSQTDSGFKITYTRQAVIPAGTNTLASLEALLSGDVDLEDALRRIRFFEDDRLLFACDDATVTPVNVTTTYAPVEETP